MVKEFREFIMRGNVIDLAVGIIIGAAFTAIVNSLVGDVLMPILGILIGGVDFSGIVITVNEAQINVGLFMNAIIQFLIIAFSVFLLIKAINQLNRKKPEPTSDAPPPPPTTEEQLLSAINKLNDTLDKMNDIPKG